MAAPLLVFYDLEWSYADIIQVRTALDSRLESLEFQFKLTTVLFYSNEKSAG